MDCAEKTDKENFETREKVLPDNVIFWNLLTSGIYSKRKFIKFTLFLLLYMDMFQRVRLSRSIIDRLKKDCDNKIFRTIT